MPASEIASIEKELTPGFTVARPAEQLAPFVFCSPHSGRVYPRSFRQKSKLQGLALRRSEDCYVDELFEQVAALGAPLIAARFPRAYLDVNREPYELDPALFRDPLPEFANTQSVRVVGGLGTIARIVSDTEEIYRERLPLAAALARIDRLYRPFHAEVSSLLQETAERFGYAVLVDCHSMPSAAIGQPAASRPDFVLGDRFGTSCDPKVTRIVREAMAANGFDVKLNRPYAGGFITEHYGRPTKGFHSIQIEINRALYLDERTLQKKPGFEPLRQRLTKIVAAIFAELPHAMTGQLAAE